MSDPRLTPARADVAAAFLKGRVEAARFAEGEARTVQCAAASLRNGPSFEAGQDTELLFGERFVVYDEQDGWAWGQAALDSYVGYMRADALSRETRAPTHRVSAPRSLIFSKPDLKSPPSLRLSMNAKLTIEDESGKYLRAAGAGWIYAPHARPIGECAPDWVAEAERFIGAPYFWGGKSFDGYDCSGLIQTALEAAGIAAPRDTDMQENGLGAPVDWRADFSNLRRGDLVFWKGHVGVMLDGARFLHANAHHMATAIETLAEAVARIEAGGTPVRAIKRIA